jgi:surfactin synthase thioesterase subunit
MYNKFKEDKDFRVVFCGHSLGGAVAHLVFLRFQQEFLSGAERARLKRGKNKRPRDKHVTEVFADGC